MTAGSIADLFRGIGLRVVFAHADRVVVELPVTDGVVNNTGGIQGGLIATLIDVAAGRLALATRPSGTTVATADMFIRYLAPVRSGSARAEARIVRAGSRSVIVDVQVSEHPRGTLAAIATVNFATIAQRGAEVHGAQFQGAQFQGAELVGHDSVDDKPLDRVLEES